MGRTHTPCCSYVGLSKGPWTAEEDLRLKKYIEAHGEGNWRTLPRKAGLQRCGKGCRLRWMNYLRPNVKRGHISPDEEEMIVRLHKLLGNRWSLIAGRIPGRTDNEVKNYWNTHLRKKDNAAKGLHRNARSQCKQAGSSDKICGGGTGTLYINEHTAKDQNEGSSCSHIGEIFSILRRREEFYNCRTYVARNAESIENLKQLIDGFHDPAINMDLVNHSAWLHGNHHPSSNMPHNYSPRFEPKTQPSVSESVTPVQGHESRLLVDNSVSANYINTEKPTGDVSNNMQSKIAALGFCADDEFNIDCNFCHQFSFLPEVELGQNGLLSSCLQPEDPITGQCSEPWLSSIDWFDCIDQL